VARDDSPDGTRTGARSSVTAIRVGNTDLNDDTVADALWDPLFDTPNFPEYPSGHACATAAVAHAIEDYFDHEVPIPTHSVRTNTGRLYRKASDVVNQVIDARMLIGVHFRTANEDVPRSEGRSPDGFAAGSSSGSKLAGC
jgi:hypothetical protein